MDNILVVSAAEKATVLSDALTKSGQFGRVACAGNGGEARRTMMADPFEIVLINTPLPDETGYDLALHLSRNTEAGVVVLVRGEHADEVAAKLEDGGILVVPKPVSRPLLFQSLKMAAAARRRLLRLRSENVRLQQKIEEIRLVDRAKCVLIQTLSLTEQQAHRYIEKQAMDSRLPRREIAHQILKTYEE